MATWTRALSYAKSMTDVAARTVNAAATAATPTVQVRVRNEPSVTQIHCVRRVLRHVIASVSRGSRQGTRRFPTEKPEVRRHAELVNRGVYGRCSNSHGRECRQRLGGDHHL